MQTSDRDRLRRKLDSGGRREEELKTVNAPLGSTGRLFPLSGSSDHAQDSIAQRLRRQEVNLNLTLTHHPWARGRGRMRGLIAPCQDHTRRLSCAGGQPYLGYVGCGLARTSDVRARRRAPGTAPHAGSRVSARKRKSLGFGVRCGF
eukprot:772035-Rhodomonas_salina.3